MTSKLVHISDTPICRHTITACINDHKICWRQDTNRRSPLPWKCHIESWTVSLVLSCPPPFIPSSHSSDRETKHVVKWGLWKQRPHSAPTLLHETRSVRLLSQTWQGQLYWRSVDRRLPQNMCRLLVTRTTKIKGASFISFPVNMHFQSNT